MNNDIDLRQAAIAYAAAVETTTSRLASRSES